jgi:hypothetical protein
MRRSRSPPFRQAARGELSEKLNQAARRLLQCRDLQEVCDILTDAASDFSGHAGVFTIGNGLVHGACLRGGGDDETRERFRRLRFPLSEAPAFQAAMENGDPVVCMAAPAELSGRVVEVLTHEPDEKVHLFPISTTGVLYAWADVEAPCLELLAQVAAVAARPHLQSVPAASPAWLDLAPVDQQLHLRAQRFARVRVSEIRLYNDEAVKAGRSQKDFYGVLKPAIDSVRKTFYEKFVSASPTMVDYLHLELVRSLANDEAALLGPRYPGPLV